MAADVAHELRTPLGALQAGLEELRDGLVPAEPETLTRLHDQSVRLGRVVADLGVLAEANDVGARAHARGAPTSPGWSARRWTHAARSSGPPRSVSEASSSPP